MVANHIDKIIKLIEYLFIYQIFVTCYLICLKTIVMLSAHFDMLIGLMYAELVINLKKKKNM